MRIRLGYVAITNALDITSSSPFTYSEYIKSNNLDKLNDIIISNLEALDKIIDYNIKNNIHFYRLSSKIIPLATKEDVIFDYIHKYQSYYNKIGNKIKKSNMRVDFHPDQFCVLNSTKKEVVKNSIQILEYHYKLFQALGIKNKLLIIHVGSNVFGKAKSIERFIKNFNSLPGHLKEIIAVENDDKVFNVADVLSICKRINVPMVLDYHHHVCNKSSFNFEDVFSTWKNINPKVHFSSPKNKKEFRSHSDYINVLSFLEFIEEIKKFNIDVDIMIEAKAKDDSMFRLIRQIKYQTQYTFIDETSFNV